MPQLLIEFFSEEIPARMQKRAEEDLAKALGEKLKAAGLDAKAIKTFSSPRRIGAVIDDLPSKAADVNEERKGPRVGSPEQALQGFLKGAGLTSIDQAQIVEDKKGAFYVARIERAGRETSAIVQEIVPEIVRAFPWPKSMRSGSSDLTWVRPLHNICCVFDGKAVKIAIEGVGSEAVTWGHRFHAPEAMPVTSASDHASKLRGAKVLIEREERKTIILEQARKLCVARGLELVDDIGLLEEVAGLVEWPVVLLGDMDPAFLDLPGEVIRLSMRTHQKYFAVRDPKTQKLAPHFVTVANVEAKDGGKAIAAGNARVLSARLNDARFFWDTDRKTPLDTPERRSKLDQRVFHQRWGSIWNKVDRTTAAAVDLCEYTGARIQPVVRAVQLSKLDLVTAMVEEFPELQGQIGRQLAEADKEMGDVSEAIEDHYRPLGPSDRVATAVVAATVAIADKLDTLVCFWSIDERPTGSSDPYALRRAALGMVRTILANKFAVPLREILDLRFVRAEWDLIDRATESHVAAVQALPERALDVATRKLALQSALNSEIRNVGDDEVERAAQHTESLLAFLADRLKVQLRDQGKRHDLVDAVFALGDDDLVRIVARVEALDAFLKTEDGANLLAGYKRAANILSAEEKKGKWSAEEAQGQVDAKLLAEPAEKALHEALAKALPSARAAVEKEEFAAAMKALAGLRAPVDGFFDKVLVNAPEEQIRRNRLLLLSRFREALSAVADFSKIEG
ncbi:glycine--tRNA ligase subunit beta [Terricaulis sp.]|uniref:glycine--tRNA ligase subunit beta n=1 Tax=Terricaulis sp. TaxID=2768686 RepID=UPI002AC67815|nr:glycine--tRNA ligase subunit beta [Terricaulis sp.]MDZ4692945.1 glycine--tRNA ligase subunit beta [Terricaulis sp.]